MRRLNVEGRRIEADKNERLVGLEDRRVAVGAALRGMHDRISHTDFKAKGLLRCIENLQRELVKPGVSTADKEIYLVALQHFTSELGGEHARGGDEFVRSIHEVLNGSGAPTRVLIGTTPRQGSAQGGQVRRRRR